MDAATDEERRRAGQQAANRTLLKRLSVVAVARFGFGYLMVPLYAKFCEVTGLRNIGRPDQVFSRAQLVARRFNAAGIECELVASEAAVGGGAFPTARLESAALVINGKASELEQRLRRSTPAIVGRIVDKRLLLDMRSITAEQDQAFAAAVINALAE